MGETDVKRILEKVIRQNMEKALSEEMLDGMLTALRKTEEAPFVLNLQIEFTLETVRELRLAL